MPSVLEQDIQELFGTLPQARLDAAILPVRLVTVRCDARILEHRREQISRPHDLLRAILAVLAFALSNLPKYIMPQALRCAV